MIRRRRRFITARPARIIDELGDDLSDASGLSGDVSGDNYQSALISGNGMGKLGNRLTLHPSCQLPNTKANTELMTLARMLLRRNDHRRGRILFSFYASASSRRSPLGKPK